MVGALASGPIGPSCFCHSPPSHVIEVDDVRIYCPLIGCGVKEQRWGRFLSRGFRWAFCKASMKAEDVVADGFFECVSVIHQLFKVISHQKKKKKKWVAESGIISRFFIYLFSTLMGVFFKWLRFSKSVFNWKPECVSLHTSAWRPWTFTPFSRFTNWILFSKDCLSAPDRTRKPDLSSKNLSRTKLGGNVN